MRDPARIQEILLTLAKVWTRYPDQRLGQLLQNAVFIDDECMFTQEDDLTLKRLKEMLA